MFKRVICPLKIAQSYFNEVCAIKDWETMRNAAYLTTSASGLV